MVALFLVHASLKLTHGEPENVSDLLDVMSLEKYIL